MSIPNNAGGRGGGGGIRGTIVKSLTTISHVTSPFISVFLLVHLSAPILANVGGTSLASQTMVLGREYYQSERLETYLVLGPITLHALSGITKRLLTSTSTTTSSNNNKKPKTPSSLLNRPFTSLLSLTAYSTALFFLPLHFLIHRDYPTLPIEPIHSVGPASLDYEFVKYGLQNWPWRSWFLYTGLVSSVVLHIADGSAQIWNAFIGGGGWSGLSRKTRRSILFCGVAIPVIFGLRAMAKEPLMILKFLENRYHAVFTQSIAYQL